MMQPHSVIAHVGLHADCINKPCYLCKKPGHTSECGREQGDTRATLRNIILCDAIAVLATALTGSNMGSNIVRTHHTVVTANTCAVCLLPDVCSRHLPIQDRAWPWHPAITQHGWNAQHSAPVASMGGRVAQPLSPGQRAAALPQLPGYWLSRNSPRLLYVCVLSRVLSCCLLPPSCTCFGAGLEHSLHR